MSSPPTQQKPVDPAERDDLGEDSDDYDAEFDGEEEGEEEGDGFDQDDDDSEEEDEDEDAEQSGGGLTALLLGDGGEEADEEEEDEFVVAGSGEARAATLPATPAAGSKRTLNESEEGSSDGNTNGQQDNVSKKVKVL